MATRAKNFKEKLALAMASNPNLTKADIAELRKRYRGEYNRLLKLQASADTKMRQIATTNTKLDALPRHIMLSPETRSALLEGTFEEFFNRADEIHSVNTLVDFVIDSIEEEQSAQDVAFDLAVSIANGEPSMSFSDEPYYTGVSNAAFKIDMWWNKVITPPDNNYYRVLSPTLLTQLDRWMKATIKLIGEENFIDLLENKMGYSSEAKHGDDWETFFFQKYDESDAECISRINLWIQEASNEALSYINEDDDMGDYDEITGDIVDELSDIEALRSWK